MQGESQDSSENIKLCLEEVNSILSRVDGFFAALDANYEDKEAINELFRASHNIKGNTSYIGLNQMSRLAHKIEDLLMIIRERPSAYTPETASVLKGGFMELGSMAMRIKAGLPEVEDSAYYNSLTSGITKAVSDSKKDDISSLWKSLTTDVNLFTDKFNASDTQLQAIFTRIVFNVAALKPRQNSLQETIAQAQTEAQQTGAPAPQKMMQQPRVARIDYGKVDEILSKSDTLRQMAITVIKEHDPRKQAEMHAAMMIVADNLAADAIALKMVPFSTFLNRVPLMAADVARKVKKEIAVTIEGADTLIDKSFLEALESPITHIVRNAVDHGIETPEKRRALNKRAKGSLLVRSTKENGLIRLSVTDDGRGIDLNAVKWKAISKGMLDHAKAETMSEQEMYQLLFMPGFSTAEIATDISGRGVGMDVVKSNIESIGGVVEISSKANEGTTITLVLPKC